MVGVGLGLDFSQLVNSPSEEEGYCQADKIVSQENESDKKDAREGLGISSVRSNNRPISQSETEVVQQCLATPSTSFAARQSLTNPKKTKEYVATLHDSSKPVEVCGTVPPEATVVMHTDASLTGWGGHTQEH